MQTANTVIEENTTFHSKRFAVEDGVLMTKSSSFVVTCTPVFLALSCSSIPGAFLCMWLLKDLSEQERISI